MSHALLKATAPHIRVSRMKTLALDDIHNLCQATEAAIADGIGFNWLTPPAKETLESYWKGVLMVPERVLIGAWLDGVLCGATLKRISSRHGRGGTAWRFAC
jgi:hypothetical protein